MLTNIFVLVDKEINSLIGKIKIVFGSELIFWGAFEDLVKTFIVENPTGKLSNELPFPNPQKLNFDAELFFYWNYIHTVYT